MPTGHDYEKKSFSVPVSSGKVTQEEWDRIFGNTGDDEPPKEKVMLQGNDIEKYMNDPDVDLVVYVDVIVGTTPYIDGKAIPKKEGVRYVERPVDPAVDPDGPDGDRPAQQKGDFVR